MTMFCKPACGTNPTISLASQPCFYCPGIPEPEPTPDLLPPEPNTSPSALSRKPDSDDFLVGTGLSSEWAHIVSDTLLETFLAPCVPPPGGHMIGPSVDSAYGVHLTGGQQLAMVFGVTSLIGVKITDLYDVSISVEALATMATAHLEFDATMDSGYKWVTTVGNITDSIGNSDFTTVQNATRLAFLVAATLLPAGALGLVTSTWTITATHIPSGSVMHNTVTVTVI